MHFAEVRDDLVDALGDRHRGAHREQAVQLDRLTEAVRPRQERERAVLRAHGEDFVHRADVARDVLVRELHALRIARRARRVDEAGDVGRRRPQRCDGLFVAAPLEVGPRDRDVLAGAAEHDDVLQIRQTLVLVLRLEDRVPRLVVGDDHELGAAVAQDVRPLLDVLRLVHRHVRGVAPVGRVRGDRPLRAVVRDDADAISLADAERREAAAHVGDITRELGERHPVPRAVALLAEERAIAVTRGGAVEDVDEGLELRSERRVGHERRAR